MPKNTEIQPLDGFTQDGFLTRDQLDSFDPNMIEQFTAALGLTEADLSYVASEWTRVDKAELVGVPFFVVEWELKVSKEFGGLYAVVYGIIQDGPDKGQKVVFADGGTGVAAQLAALTKKRQDAGLIPEAHYHAVSVANGLARSDYDAHENSEGVMVPAGTTYYLG